MANTERIISVKILYFYFVLSMVLKKISLVVGLKLKSSKVVERSLKTKTWKINKRFRKNFIKFGNLNQGIHC